MRKLKQKQKVSVFFRVIFLFLFIFGSSAFVFKSFNVVQAFAAKTIMLTNSATYTEPANPSEILKCNRLASCFLNLLMKIVTTLHKVVLMFCWLVIPVFLFGQHEIIKANLEKEFNLNIQVEYK